MTECPCYCVISSLCLILIAEIALRSCVLSSKWKVAFLILLYVTRLHRPPYILQAETENEMREWISAFEKAKRLMLQNTQSVNEEPPSKPTTEDVPALNTPVTEQPKEKPSIVMLSSTPENDQKSLTRSTSMTPLLVWEASRAALTTATSTSTPTSPATQSFSQAALSLDAAAAEDSSSTTTTSTWGIPWALVPSMFQGGSTDDIKSELPPTPGSPNAPSVIDADGHQIIWPTRVDDSNAPKVNINGYLPQLDISNKELRHLFGGVDPKEVVLFGKGFTFEKVVVFINYVFRLCRLTEEKTTK